MPTLSLFDRDGLEWSQYGRDKSEEEERRTDLVTHDTENKFRQLELPLFYIYPRDANSVIMIPEARYFDLGDPEADEQLWRNETETWNLWKTLAVYDKIGNEHPRFPRLLGREEWTGLPILEKPSGGSLDGFMKHYRKRMYQWSGSSPPRVKDAYLPIIYQWCLHLTSALSHLHSYGIAFGEMLRGLCWLSSPELDLFLLGFTGSHPGVDPDQCVNGSVFDGWFMSGEPFSPDDPPTLRTDMFCFATLVYEMMVSARPGDESGKTDDEIKMMVREREWPDVEDKYMGAVLHKCWNYGYEDIEQLSGDVKRYIEAEGWDIEEFKGDDKFKGLNTVELLEKLNQESEDVG